MSISKVTTKDFDEFNGSLQSAALKSTKHALSLPSPADTAFHRSVDPEIARDLDAFSSRLLRIANSLLNFAATAKEGGTDEAGGRRKLDDVDDVVDSFQSVVVDAMDQLLEHVDTSLDAYSGRTKPPSIAVNPAEPLKQKPPAPRGRLDPALLHASTIPKPQLQFSTKPVNADDGIPWRPSLKHKYNARVPLGYIFAEWEGSTKDAHTTTHPYAYEIMHLEHPEHMFYPTTTAPLAPRSFSETPFSWVETPAEFATMLDKLRGAKEMAVDLEHHSYRTWAGFLCLMQLSTRDEDFVVDLLVPDIRQLIPELNEVFTDPEIVKVFHGADSDIVWLQQDFGVYIVNLFDTYHASKVLEFSRHGLANLLKAYCDFMPDKRYQLADWRIRPLPKEMLEYARSDTHFLLYIYDNLRNALHDRPSAPSSSSDPEHNPIKVVLTRSGETALRTYEKETYDPEGGGSGGWNTLARRWNKGGLMKGSLGLQGRVYRGVHAWRDKVAREEDESQMYVLTNAHLFTLAERPPRDMATLLGTFKNTNPPHVVRKRAAELLEVILTAVKEAEDETRNAGVDMDMKLMEMANEPEIVKVDVATKEKPEAALAARLWARHSIATSMPLNSILLRPDNGVKSFATSTSVLFAKPPSVPKESPAGSFLDILNKIHRSLIIAPSVPRIMPDQNETSREGLQPAIPGQVEIPFVPVTQRQQPADVIDDSIVVVGHARKKKRKRTKTDSAGGLAVGSEKGHAEEDEVEVEVFDYTTVPNILDDVPVAGQDTTGRKKKKQKHQKGGVLEYGNFPAPPKAHRELKSGNQSYTFK